MHGATSVFLFVLAMFIVVETALARWDSDRSESACAPAGESVSITSGAKAAKDCSDLAVSFSRP